MVLCPAVSLVSIDAKAMELAVHHLVQRGHRRIAHIAGPQNVSTGYYRCRGFCRACRELSKLGVTPAVVYGTEFTIECGEITCRALLRDHPNVTAIAAANDMLAVGALRHLQSLGIRCPANISIIGMNDMPFMDAIAPPLTTIRTPTAELGKHAAAILVDMINVTPIQNRQVELEPELVVRKSVTTMSAAKTLPNDRLAAARQ
jgi:LacI family transcriptional regulator